MTARRLARLASWFTGVFLLVRLTIDRAANPQDHSLGWAIGTVRHWLRVDAADPRELQALWFWWGDEHDAPYSHLLDWPYDNGVPILGLCAIIAWSAVVVRSRRLVLFLCFVLALSAGVFVAAFLRSHLTIFYTNYTRNAFYLDFAWFPVVSTVGLALDAPPKSAWQVSRAVYECSNTVGRHLFSSCVVGLWSLLVGISVRARLRGPRKGCRGPRKGCR
jgi:hypothetical protein